MLALMSTPEEVVQRQLDACNAKDIGAWRLVARRTSGAQPTVVLQAGRLETNSSQLV